MYLRTFESLSAQALFRLSGRSIWQFFRYWLLCRVVSVLHTPFMQVVHTLLTHCSILEYWPICGGPPVMMHTPLVLLIYGLNYFRYINDHTDDYPQTQRVATGSWAVMLPNFWVVYTNWHQLENQSNERDDEVLAARGRVKTIYIIGVVIHPKANFSLGLRGNVESHRAKIWCCLRNNTSKYLIRYLYILIINVLNLSII